MLVESPKKPDFAAIKQAVSMAQILDHYGLTPHLRRTGDHLTGTCPLHNGHNPGQFRVSLTKNCWYCFGDCQAGGSILDFVSRKEGLDLREAALLIQDWFGLNADLQRLNRSDVTRPVNGKAGPQIPPTHKAEPNPVLSFTLQRLESSHPYLIERGLTPGTIQAFGLGCCRSGLMAGRIVIPIHNPTGDLVAYTGRWPGIPSTDQPKYIFPRGFRKSLEVFNLHRALQANSNGPLIVVEGYFGCFRLWQIGFHRTVALMGSSLSDAQAELLLLAVKARDQILLLFDEDNSGRVGREKAWQRLSPHRDVRVIALPQEGQQPDDLSPEQVQALGLCAYPSPGRRLGRVRPVRLAGQ